MWDLGAGSGLIALEACALTYRGSVFAVERDPERAARIREQRRCFGAANLEIILGNAPECLEYLPDPDAVFLGGGLGDPQNADRLLHLVHTRLKTGGRLVISCVLLGSLERCRAFLKKNAPHAELFCIQASEAVPLANDLRLAADNPVFLAGCVKAD